ncbi:MAG TPA: glycosyltransferase [Acidimicrobiales bacterium]|nr:glycosyltransferase [Acidimicrobiales bacterium]
MTRRTGRGQPTVLAGGGVRFATTVGYGDHPGWAARGTLVSPTLGSRHGALDEARHLARVLRAIRRFDALVLDSSSGRFHPDLVALAVLPLLRRRRRPVVVFMGCMWEPDDGWLGRLQRLAVRLADRSITLYAVQSSAELGTFPRTWGVDGDKVRFVPYFFTLTDDDVAVPLAPPDRPYVFAGGDSHREYGPLLETARRLPGTDFVLATRCLEDATDLPPNVRAGSVSRAVFMEQLRGAAAVVVPLRRQLARAAGQQTYLNAMRLGKPTVVVDSPGVEDHVRDGATAVVVDGSAQAYERALGRLLDPARAGEAARMGEAARADVSERFTFLRHADRLLEILDEAAGPRRRPAGR